MKQVRRRLFLQALLASSACALPACGKQSARAGVLRTLVERVMVPNTAAVAADSRRLETDMAQLADGAVTSLLAARQSWQRTLSSWKRVDAFRVGPISDSNSLMRVMFWPVRSAGIDALLQGSQPIDDESIDVMGVDRRGLFALEYLLFPQEPDEQAAAGFAGSDGERRVRLARALAGNVSAYAERMVHSLGNGKTYASKFAEGGQDSVNRLVAQLVYTVENVKANRLARISRLVKSGTVKPSDIEGGSGRMSQQIALSYLRATEELYLASDLGLCVLVATQSSTTDHALRLQFARSIKAVADLGAPLEEAAQRDPAHFASAVQDVKELEHALKVDLASLLGVTATFASVDGD